MKRIAWQVLHRNDLPIIYLDFFLNNKYTQDLESVVKSFVFTIGIFRRSIVMEVVLEEEKIEINGNYPIGIREDSGGVDC